MEELDSATAEPKDLPKLVEVTPKVAEVPLQVSSLGVMLHHPL